MRDYNLMRNMLVFVSNGEERALNDFCHFGDVRSVGKELSRLREEGLIDSDMSFEPFDYQLDRHCSKTAEHNRAKLIQFDYQLDRHCSKTL